MLVEMAVGDAYGACFEFCDPEFVARGNDLRGYLEHPRHVGLRPGDYTDDTQMSIALAELLVAGVPFTHDTVGEKFLEVFKRDPRVGYSRRMLRALEIAQSGRQLRTLLREGSSRNGAAMRSAVLGYLPDPTTIVEYSDCHSEVSHNTPLAKLPARAVALSVFYLRQGIGPVGRLGGWLDGAVPPHSSGASLTSWSEPWKGPVGSRADECVRAGLTVLGASRSLSEVLRRAVSFTGDVDTVAAITMAMASCCEEIDQDIPRNLVDDLEGGDASSSYGAPYLHRLDSALLDLPEVYGA